MEVSEEDLGAYRELAGAGIMIPVSGFTKGPESHFRFTAEGWDRRLEWFGSPPGELSEAAEFLLRRRLSGERVEVTEESRPAYRELAVAGLAEPISTFVRRPEGHFRLTKEACDRREEWLESPASGRPQSP